MATSLIVVICTLGFATNSVSSGPSSQIMSRLGAGVPSIEHGHFQVLLTSALWANDLAGYILISIALLTVGGALERRLGTLRFALSSLAIQILGTASAIAVVAGVNLVGGAWSKDLTTTTAVGLMPTLMGLLLASTVSMGALWRRRIRLAMLVVLVTLALYGGLLEDVVRFTCGVVGLAFGYLTIRHNPRQNVLRSTRRELRVLVAVVVVATALGPVLAATSPSSVGPLSVLQYLFAAPSTDAASLHAVCTEQLSPEACADLKLQLRLDGVGPSVLALLPAVLALAVADGLRRGRRFGWWCAVILHFALCIFGLALAVSVVTAPTEDIAAYALAGGKSLAGVIVPLVQPFLVLLLLIVTRPVFDISAPARTTIRYFSVLSVSLVTLLVCFFVFTMLWGSQFDSRPTAVDALKEFWLRLVPPGYLGVIEPNFFPKSGIATFVLEWTGVIFWSIAIVGALRGFRTTNLSAPDDDAARARRLLTRDSGTSLSYITMWHGNRYFFSESGNSFVAYRLQGRVALTTGDPVGPEDDRQSVIHGFIEMCNQHQFTPCFYSASASICEVTAHLGWPNLQVAQEIVLRLSDLEFSGKKFQDVGSSLNRARREGVSAEWISYSSASLSVRDQILAISEEWVADKNLPEMGFTLGGIDELDDREVRCLIAVDEGRTIHGITSWMPVYRNGQAVGWTLDFMRRQGDGFKNVMEFLIASAALQFQLEGAEFVSLSAAPLANISASGDQTRIQQLLVTIGRILEPVYGFQSLLAFKAKFQPDYHPLHMTYPETAMLPSIANALGSAYLPDITLGQRVRLFRRM